MARTINARRSTRQDEGTKQREVTDQPTPFIGLALAPLVALLVTWLVHYSITGWTIWRWHVGGNSGYLGLAVSLATIAAGAVGWSAWHFSYDRKPVWRYALTGTTTFIGLWLPVLVWNGPNRYLDIFFVFCAWVTAAIWSQPRLHVLRRDPREDQHDADSDELIKQLGLHGYRAQGKPTIAYDEAGDVARVSADIRHRFGGTRKPLQDAIDNLASMLGTKDGFVRATAPDDGKSNHTIVTAVLKDAFAGRVPNPGPSHPGGSVTDYSQVGVYDDRLPVRVWICGGVNPTTGEKMPPTGYAFMGMTRAGKTVTENRLLLEAVITRRDGVLLYLNKAKGGQDVQPIIAGVEAAVLSDASNDYTYAMARVRDIITYRQGRLAAYGISAHSPEKCFHNPPTHTLDGRAIPMEPMPTLVVHVGEADAILEAAGEEAVYLASKGLSCGVVMGWSLQRWSATSMPTDLRFNIGTAFCFGVGDDYSAGFALSEQTIKAGAHPEYWKNRKPGQFYVENIGIEENRFPVPAKGIGDTDDDALYGNMRIEAEQYAPGMARLDKGSVEATRGWWAKQARMTDALRDTMRPRPPAETPTPSPVPDDPTPEENPMSRRTPQAYAPAFSADPPTPDEDPDVMSADEQTRSEIAATTHVNDQLIHGELIRPDRTDGSTDGTAYFDEIAATNPAVDPAAPGADDEVDLTDPKPEAPTRQDAELAFDDAIRAALADPRFADEDDLPRRSAVVRTGQLQELFRFRSRSWYSPILREMADGDRFTPPGIRIERLPDRTGEGWYRIIDTSSETESHSGNSE